MHQPPNERRNNSGQPDEIDIDDPPNAAHIDYMLSSPTAQSPT
jgi:hypothetical protein